MERPEKTTDCRLVETDEEARRKEARGKESKLITGIDVGQESMVIGDAPHDQCLMTHDSHL